MRKRIFLALCLVLALVLMAVPAMAANSVDAWVNADSSSVSAGSTVTVTVSAEVDNCGSGGIAVSFDSAVFDLTGGSCSLSGTDLSYFDPATRDGAFAYSGSSAISGQVFQFTLKAKSTAPAGSSTVNVTFIADGTSVSRSISISLACDHSYDNDCDEKCNTCGGTREVSHSYDSGKVTAQATCNQEGVKTFTCTACKATKTEPIEKTEHTFDEGKITAAATCDKEGTKTFTCSICKETKTETVDKLEHSFGEGTVTKEATCDQAGEKTYTCTACGYEETRETDKLPHVYDVVGYEPATCEENGEMVFTCSVCGYTYDDYIEAKGHSYDYDCDPDCNTCGAVRDTDHDFGEDWFSDKREHYRQCNICGYTEEPVPHTPGPEATDTEDQVCLDCGFVLEAAGKHTHKPVGNFLSNDQQHWFLCECGELMSENDHRWEDKGIEGDQHIYKCMICSRIKSEPVPTTAPTTVPTETTTAPTTAPTQPTEPEKDGILDSPLLKIIPLAIVALGLVGIAGYISIGLILGYRKKGKFAAKKASRKDPDEEYEDDEDDEDDEDEADED